MSYCRFSADSDVYVIHNQETGLWECVGCKHDPDVLTAFSTRDELRDHLMDHLISQHKVPKYAIDRLDAERRAEYESAKPKWTPEEAEALMKQLSLYYGEPVRKVSEYCDAFRVWAKAIQAAFNQETDEQRKSSFGRMVDDIRRTELHVSKSNLLARLIYGGEKLRSEPCPIHKGHWSGCVWGFEGRCPHCMSGADVTGWKKEP